MRYREAPWWWNEVKSVKKKYDKKIKGRKWKEDCTRVWDKSESFQVEK